MSDTIKLYKGDTFDPIGAMRFRAKAMFAKPITRDEFTSMQVQLSHIEEKLASIKLDNSHLSTEVSAIHAIAIDIASKTYMTLATLEKKIDALGAKDIVITPPSVTITGGKNSKATITASQAANPRAIFVASSSNQNIVTVSPAIPGPGTQPNSFVITEITAGSAIITITDNAVPANAATINVIAV